MTSKLASHNSLSDMNTTIRTKSPPLLLTWLFALMSVSFAIILAVTGVAYSLRLASGDLFSRVAEALSAQQWAVARQLITDASQPAPLDRWVYSERELVHRGLRAAAAREMLLLLEQAKSAKTPAFMSTFDRVQRSLGGLQELSPSLQSKLAGVEQFASGIVSLWRERDQIDTEIAAIDTDLRGTVRTFYEARNRMARALGLPYDEQIPTAITRPQPFTTGVLTDLPTLPGLIDNIPDLNALKEQITNLGGQVAYSGPTAAEDFRAEIISIQTLTRKALDDFDGRTSRKESVAERRVKIADEIAARVPRINVIGSEIVLELVSENWPARGAN